MYMYCLHLFVDCAIFILPVSIYSKLIWVYQVNIVVSDELLSHVWLFVTPWTAGHQNPVSMEFSRQEYWSGFPFPSPGDLPNPGIKPGSPALQDSLLSEPPGKLMVLVGVPQINDVEHLFVCLLSFGEMYIQSLCLVLIFNKYLFILFNYLFGCAKS